MDRSVVTRVEHRDWQHARDRIWRGQRGAKQRRKVAGPFHIGRQSTRVLGRAGALVVPILLPREKEKTLVMALIKLGNPDRTAQAPAKVILMISRLRRALQIFRPEFGVHLVVA